MKGILRKIYFYRVDAGLTPAGKSIPYDPLPTLQHINGLPWTNKGRYWNDNGKRVACWVDSLNEPYKASLGFSRQSDLPQLEVGGEVSPIEMDEKSGLLDRTFIVFFGDGVVGSDHNFYGPRISRFAYYLAEKAVGVAPPQLHFRPLYRQDLYRQLKNLTHLKLFDLRVRAPFVEKIKNHDQSLAAAFENSLAAGDADEVGVLLKVETRKRSHNWLRPSLLRFIREVLKSTEWDREVNKFTIKGYDASDQEDVVLDLLNQKIVAQKKIIRQDPKTRALNPTNAYNAIIAAYRELREEIKESASIEL